MKVSFFDTAFNQKFWGAVDDTAGINRPSTESFFDAAFFGWVCFFGFGVRFSNGALAIVWIARTFLWDYSIKRFEIVVDRDFIVFCDVV